MSGALSGQRALVTGASSGIGAAIATRLAAEGADLVITARRRDRLVALAESLREKYGVTVDVEAVDLSDPSAPEQLFSATELSGKHIDLLVNNAGLGMYASFDDVDWDHHRALIAVNMTALTELCHRFVPVMRERGRGRVLNVASIGAYMPCPEFAVYTASKAYVRNFTEALDYELKGTGVSAAVVCPGGTRTEFLEHANQTLTKSGEKFMMSAERCANIAVDQMLAGKRTIVTGWINVLACWLLRWVPRVWMPGVAHISMSSGVKKTK